MEKEEVKKLIDLRTRLITTFVGLRDYKNNKNALMKEQDHARVIHNTIVALDDVLKKHVEFSDKK